MDNKVTLQALSSGLKPVLNAQNQSSGSAMQNQDPTLQQVAAPAAYSSVNLGDVNENSDDTYQQSFQNNSGATRNIILGSSFSLPGEYQYYNNLVPSAIDFATFLAPSATYPNNAGDLGSLAKRFVAMPAIIKSIWLQSNVPSQSTQNIIVGKVTKSGNFLETTKYAPMCDACDNNNTTLYTKLFEGVYSVGKNSYVKIPIVQHLDNGTQYTTVRISWVGEASVANLSSTSSF